MTLRSRLRKSFARKLLRSWLIQGVGWYAMWEVMARALLELGVIILLAVLGADFLGVVAGWLLFHTAAWLVVYGGFLKIWTLRGVSTDVVRLRFHLDRVSRKVKRQTFFRTVFLRGSGARGEISGTSDIDICAVPELTVRARIRGVLFWWALRAESVFRFFPLEARWIDAERYVPYHVIQETPLVLKQRPPKGASWASSRGALVTLSGIDGSGKSTAAERLVGSLRASGFDAAYFYGHRKRWDPATGATFSGGIAFESIWKRLAGRMDRLEAHPWAKALYDVATFADYLFVLGRLSGTMIPGRIVVTDRYVADVVAYLRTRGRLKLTIEGLFLAVSEEPDLALLLELDPEKALERKREWPLPKLRKFAAEYADLKTLLSLTPVDASGPPDEVFERIEALVRNRLRMEEHAEEIAQSGAPSAQGG